MTPEGKCDVCGGPMARFDKRLYAVCLNCPAKLEMFYKYNAVADKLPVIKPNSTESIVKAFRSALNPDPDIPTGPTNRFKRTKKTYCLNGKLYEQ